MESELHKRRSCIEKVWNVRLIYQIRSCKNIPLLKLNRLMISSIDKPFSTLREFGIERKSNVANIQRTLCSLTSIRGRNLRTFWNSRWRPQVDGIPPAIHIIHDWIHNGTLSYIYRWNNVQKMKEYKLWVYKFNLKRL